MADPDDVGNMEEWLRYNVAHRRREPKRAPFSSHYEDWRRLYPDAPDWGVDLAGQISQVRHDQIALESMMTQVFQWTFGTPDERGTMQGGWVRRLDEGMHELQDEAKKAAAARAEKTKWSLGLRTSLFVSGFAAIVGGVIVALANLVH